MPKLTSPLAGAPCGPGNSRTPSDNLGFPPDFGKHGFTHIPAKALLSTSLQTRSIIFMVGGKKRKASP